MAIDPKLVDKLLTEHGLRAQGAGATWSVVQTDRAFRYGSMSPVLRESAISGATCSENRSRPFARPSIKIANSSGVTNPAHQTDSAEPPLTCTLASTHGRFTLYCWTFRWDMNGRGKLYE